MVDLLEQFDTIVLDMNNTFVFGGDRFSLTEDYFQTYKLLGGSQLNKSQVSRVINNVFNTLEPIYVDEAQMDNFPTIAETMDWLPESTGLPPEEKARFVETFTLHELGAIPPEYADALKKLSQTHTIHLVSNIWSPSDRFFELLKLADVAKCFESIVLSSDCRSIKPSPKLLQPQLAHVDPNKCVVIGDCQRCDVGLAENSGMKAIWLSHGRPLSKDQPLPEFIANDLLSLVSNDISNPTDGSVSSKLIRLRPTRPSDLNFVLTAENDPDNSPFIVNWTHSQHLESLSNNDHLHLIVETIEDSRTVGFIIVRGVAQSRGPVELKRIVITEKSHGYGVATLELLKDLAFNRLSRRRLWLNVLTTNSRARRLYRRAGFRYEGTWKDSFLTEGDYADLELMTALSTDSDEGKVFEHDGEAFRFTRNFSSNHFRQFAELYDQEWPNKNRTHEDLEKAIMGSDFALGIVQQESDDLVAFCRIVSDRGFRAWIHGLVVREDLRQTGLGRRMMDQVLGIEELVGIHSVGLTCAPKMIAFYRKWGFEVWKDETVMTLKLRRDLPSPA